MRAHGLRAAALSIALVAGLALAGCSSDAGESVQSPAASSSAADEPSGDASAASSPSTAADAGSSGPADAPPDAAPTVAGVVEGREHLEPAGLEQSVGLDQGVRIWVSDMQAIEATDARPGELGGPAVQFDVLITNESDAPLDLATLAVNTEYGPDVVPASTVSGGSASPLTGIVPVGSTVRGTYVFVVPEDKRSPLRITVDLAAEDPIVTFEGDGPR